MSHALQLTHFILLHFWCADFLGFIHHWVLVHRAFGERYSVPQLGVSGSPQVLLDDRLL